MPANLTPQYKKAEEAFRSAQTREDKLAALMEMMATVPKHKGTEKIQADIKHRIAKLKEEPVRKPSGSRRQDPFHVERSGAGQAVLFGLPNVGKSSIVGRLTRAKVQVGEYPFATTLPVAGIAFFEDVPIQLVDMPPVVPEAVSPQLFSLVRLTDVILLVVDLSRPDALEQLESCVQILKDRYVVPTSEPLPAIREGQQDEQEHLSNQKPCLVVGTKLDVPGSRDNLDTLTELYRGRLPVLGVSAASGENLDHIPAGIFRLLNVIRVYSKEPGKPPDLDEPFVIRLGGTVTDVARMVHRALPERIKYARIWGSGKFDGQTVAPDHLLRDKDTVELHG